MASDGQASLKKSMGLSGLVFYGIGTILGAGIFVVIGEVMGRAGALAPFAYGLAAVVAILSALSFAELAARIPTAGGPIDYTEQAFGTWLKLPAVVGWMLIVANIVSGATIATGFVSYLSSFVEVAHWQATVGLVILLGVISIAGMKQSAWFMTLTTLIGLVTLLLMLWLMRGDFVAWPHKLAAMENLGSATALTGVFTGAFLAMYSFIGFGDVAQAAEEVKDVKRNMPRAMWLIMLVVLAFYLAVAVALGGRDDMEAVAGADAPLVYAAAKSSGFPAMPLAIASLLVIVNGALTQIIAASRLLLDMGRDGRSGLPRWLGRTNGLTRTPVIATLVTLVAVLLLALFVPLGTLASGTSLAILAVFVMVNVSLWRLKRRGQPEDVPDLWMVVPVLGAILCTLTIIGQIVLWVMGVLA